MLTEAALRRTLRPLTAAFVLAYFLFFTWRGVHLYFDPDDMMNLYLAWRQSPAKILEANLLFFRSDVNRPMGALFYRAVYALAGFNPLPFHLVCLAIGAGNIAVCYWFTKLVARSERVAAMASLLFAFHPRLLEIWYRTAVVYDLLCFTFLYLAACLYIAGRRHGGFPGPGRVAAILACYLAALDSKEMAIALPLILLAWEMLDGQARGKHLWLTGCLAAMNLPYLYARTQGASPLAANPYYAPHYTWTQFQGSWAVYLQYIFLREQLQPWHALAILSAMLLAALALRSRGLLLAWIVIFFGTLPVSFIPYRGGYALYIAWAGWVLYAAIVLVGLQDAMLRRWPQYRLQLACFVFALVAWRAGKRNLHDQRVDPRRWLYDPADLVHSMTNQMRALQPELPHGARILFAEDSFTTEEWTPYFIMKLAWHDDSLVVDRIKMMKNPPVDWRDYQYVFRYDRGAYRQLKP